MSARLHLTALEIEAVLAVAGAAVAPAVFEDDPDRKQGARMLAAYERGAAKLRRKLANMQRGRR